MNRFFTADHPSIVRIHAQLEHLAALEKQTDSGPLAGNDHARSAGRVHRGRFLGEPPDERRTTDAVFCDAGPERPSPGRDCLCRCHPFRGRADRQGGTGSPGRGHPGRVDGGRWVRHLGIRAGPTHGHVDREPRRLRAGCHSRRRRTVSALRGARRAVGPDHLGDAHQAAALPSREAEKDVSDE